MTPKPTLKLSSEDGNIFVIVGRARGAMRRAGVPDETINQMCDRVTAAAGYDEALQIVMGYCEVK